MSDTVRQLLTRSPHDRLSASAFQQSPLFDNILMNSIKFLDSFPEKTKNEKTSFLRGFLSILPQFSDRIRLRKVSALTILADLDSTGSARPCSRYGFIAFIAAQYIRHNQDHVPIILFGQGVANGQRHHQVKGLAG